MADVKLQWDIPKVTDQIEKSLGKGLLAAAAFLKARAIELVSVPAPRTRVLGKRGKFAGVLYYRATTAATPGAPPRKLSGLLRSRFVTTPDSDGKGVTLSNTAAYAGYLEYGGHPFLSVTVESWAAEVMVIICNQTT